MNNYDPIAKGFADLRSEFNTEQKYIDLFLQYLPAKPHVLDVGCGSGLPIADYLLKHHCEVTGLDKSQKLLAIAKENCPTMHLYCGDMRTIAIEQQFDGVLEWWSLFHVPKADHHFMIERFSSWLKKDGILEFTSGDAEYEGSATDMLNYELHFYSLGKNEYEQSLIKNGFEILLCEHDQEQHLVWIARKL